MAIFHASNLPCKENIAFAGQLTRIIDLSYRASAFSIRGSTSETGSYRTQASPRPLNLITLHRWEVQLWDGMPISLIVGFHQPGKGTWMLSAYGLADAIREAADLAGLDAEFRDAQGEEWDILIPDAALAYEFPDGHIGDSWVERRRLGQLSVAWREPDDPNFHWEWKRDHGVVTVKLPPRYANLPWERKAVIFERWRARYYPKFDKHWELKGDRAVLTVRLPARQTNQPQPWEWMASKGNS